MSTYFPTEFAMKIAMEEDVFPKKDISKYYLHSKNKKKKLKARKAHDQWERLESFQNLSIAGSFKESMIAYSGIEVSKKQKKALKKIHASTTIWAKGKLIDKVISKLADSASGREVKELSEIMIKVLGMEVEAGAGNGSGLEAYVITKAAKV